MAMAPLDGAAYAIDNATVFTIIQHLIAGNEEAESKIVNFVGTTDGRGCHIALKNHYQGFGIMAMDVTTAESTISNLFYNGEKRSYMWWNEFERQLTYAYAQCLTGQEADKSIWSNRSYKDYYPRSRQIFLGKSEGCY